MALYRTPKMEKETRQQLQAFAVARLERELSDKQQELETATKWGDAELAQSIRRSINEIKIALQSLRTATTKGTK